MLILIQIPTIQFSVFAHALLLIYRDLIVNGENLILNLLLELTAGIVDISAIIISFNGGPFGVIRAILDKFGPNFNDLATFLLGYITFKADLLDLTPDKPLLFDLSPISLPRFPTILQIGSKIAGRSLELRLGKGETSRVIPEDLDVSLLILMNSFCGSRVAVCRPISLRFALMISFCL